MNYKHFSNSFIYDDPGYLDIIFMPVVEFRNNKFLMCDTQENSGFFWGQTYAAYKSFLKQAFPKNYD